MKIILFLILCAYTEWIAHANVTLKKSPQLNPTLSSEWNPCLAGLCYLYVLEEGFVCRMLLGFWIRRGVEAVVKIKKYYKLQFKIDLKQFQNKKQLHIKFKQPLKLERKKNNPHNMYIEKREKNGLIITTHGGYVIVLLYMPCHTPLHISTFKYYLISIWD